MKFHPTISQRNKITNDDHCCCFSRILIGNCSVRERSGTRHNISRFLYATDGAIMKNSYHQQFNEDYEKNIYPIFKPS
jgi:hypothetical protein